MFGIQGNVTMLHFVNMRVLKQHYWDILIVITPTGNPSYIFFLISLGFSEKSNMAFTEEHILA